MKSLDACFFKQKVSVGDIVSTLEKELDVSYQLSGGRADFWLDGVCDSRKGGSQCLVFIEGHTKQVYPKIERSFILTRSLSEAGTSDDSNCYCKVSDPRAVFIDLLIHYMNKVGISPHSCTYLDEAKIDESAIIETGSIVENGVTIGRNSHIRSGAVIRKGTIIGNDTIIGENTSIGGTGITVYRTNDGRLLKFPHVAGVFIGDSSEIGAGCVIPRGILSSTTIGDRVIIGNLSNIGHGVSVGHSVWMSVGTLVGGHTEIGTGVTIGMGATIRDNLSIGRNASIGMGSVVAQNVKEEVSVFGNPAKRVPGLTTGPKR